VIDTAKHRELGCGLISLPFDFGDSLALMRGRMLVKTRTAISYFRSRRTRARP